MCNAVWARLWYPLVFSEVLTKDFFKLGLSDFFEEKTDSDIELLYKAAETELAVSEATDEIEFTNLFTEVRFYSDYQLVIGNDNSGVICLFIRHSQRCL